MDQKVEVSELDKVIEFVSSRSRNDPRWLASGHEGARLELTGRIVALAALGFAQLTGEPKSKDIPPGMVLADASRVILDWDLEAVREAMEFFKRFEEWRKTDRANRDADALLCSLFDNISPQIETLNRFIGGVPA